jgi:hypothetical protein
VESITLIADRETGRLCGFGFVDMASGVTEAIAALHERNLDGEREGLAELKKHGWLQWLFAGLITSK